jgi:hypothetical protein
MCEKDWTLPSSEEFQREYARRAGIKGTISQGVRVCGLRRTRYVGEAKVHLQHVAMAAAINVLRIGDWLMDRPREQTRTSAFAELMRLPAAAWRFRQQYQVCGKTHLRCSVTRVRRPKPSNS